MKKSSKKIEPIDLTQFGKELSQEQTDQVLEALKDRFESNMHRHPGIQWPEVSDRLNDVKLRSLNAMELTGGEPDVVGMDKKSGELLFYDCSAETPEGRRTICYDRAGQKMREKKGVFPAGNALDIASAMGITILDEQEYRMLQGIEEFDTKTSSWIMTPPDIRKLGGAIFADRRYGHVFVYHNSAHSFYGARGFRGSLRV